MKRVLASLLLLLFCAITAFAARNTAGAVFRFPEKNPAIALNRDYGQQAMKEKLYKNAIGYFTLYKAEAKSPSDLLDATRLLARAYLLDGQPKESLNLVNEYLTVHGTPKKADFQNDLFLTAGQANLVLKDYAAAAKFLTPLLESAKDSPLEFRAQVFTAVADVWNATGHWDETSRFLESHMVSFPSTSPECTALSWRYLDASISQNQWQKARDTITLLKAMRISDREQVTLKLLWIRCCIGEDKPQEALQNYRDWNLPALLTGGQDWRWSQTLQLLAQSCQTKGLQKDAAEIYGIARKVATSSQEATAVAKLQVEALVAIGDLEQAKKLLNELHGELPEDRAITWRLAEIRKALSERQGAGELFLLLARDETQSRPQRYRAAMEAAQCLVQTGQAKEAADAFRMAGTLADSPADQAGAVRMAAEQAEKIQLFAEAIKLYIEVADQFGAQVPAAEEARLEAGRLMFQEGDCDGALQQYQIFLQNQPESPRKWEARLAIGKATKDHSQAVEKLLTVARECPDAHLGTLAFFEAHSRALAKGEAGLEQALQILKEFLEKYPDVDKEKIRMVRHKNLVLGFALGKPETLVWGKEFLAEYPGADETPEVALRLGDWLSDQEEYSEAILFYQQAFHYPKASSELKAMARYEEAFCSARKPDGLDDALKLLEDFENCAASARLCAQAFFLKGDLLTQKNSLEKALEAYAAAQEKAGKDLIGYAALGRRAEILYATGNLAEATKCAQEIYTHGGGGDVCLHARACLILARCYRQNGNVDEAERLYHEIRQKYEPARKKAPQALASPQVYIAAVQDLLEILDARHEKTLARTVRESYSKNPQLPPLPAH